MTEVIADNQHYWFVVKLLPTASVSAFTEVIFLIFIVLPSWLLIGGFFLCSIGAPSLFVAVVSALLRSPVL